GQAERKVMWIIQRILEPNCSFWPLADNYKESPFVRSFQFKIWDSAQNKYVFIDIFDTNSGKFHSDFGVDSDSGFAIYKYGRDSGAGVWVCGGSPIVFVAVNRFVIDANKNVEALFKPGITDTAQIDLPVRSFQDVLSLDGFHNGIY
ncbi:MAG TPA: hypothetical protein VHD33_00295, partial [Legionellaceae bacterium]|nr:hypothetical protein [Legionellaceae bacterium]